MEKATVIQFHSSFEALVQTHPDTGTEFWLARNLQMLLGYTQWRNFEAVIQKAVTACQTSGHNPADHFARLSKMVPVGSGAQRQIEDIALTRYACYLIAQNGDPPSPPSVAPLQRNAINPPPAANHWPCTLGDVGAK